MSIIIALLVFSILVIVHEWGHYIAAKKCGVYVEEFAIGMGPAIYKRQGKETLFSIRILPIGGYCKMNGEDEASTDANAFCNKNVWQKMLIVVAGAGMNFVYASVLMFLITNFIEVTTNEVEIVEDNSPAQEAGIQIGDRIVGINGKHRNLMEDIKFDIAVDDSEDETIEVMFTRDNKEMVAPLKYKKVLMVLDQTEEKSDVITLGTKISKINGKNINEIKSIKDEVRKENANVTLFGQDEVMDLTDDEVEILFQNRNNVGNMIGVSTKIGKLGFFDAMVYGFNKLGYYVTSTYKSLELMVTGRVSRNQISGPVGIMKMIGDTYSETSKKGLGSVLVSLASFSIMLSMNLGIVNLLPLPALDGGRFFILLIEAIRRKPMNTDREAMIHFVGFCLLMVLMAFIFFNDIARLLGF